MKKEKQVKSYQRRTKSGKMITVRAHTAKYDAAEKAKEAAKKKGAGDELENKKSKMPNHNLSMEDYLEELKKKRKDREISEQEKVSKEDARTQERETKRITKRVASLEKKLHDLKYTYSGLRRDDPKKLKYAKRIQELQSDLIATKKTSAYQNSVSTENLSNKKTSKATTVSKPATSEPAFTAAEFKEWYRGTGSAADKKVAKALRAQLGRAGYRKFEDEAIDNYSSRGHLSMFKRVSG